MANRPREIVSKGLQRLALNTPAEEGGPIEDDRFHPYGHDLGRRNQERIERSVFGSRAFHIVDESLMVELRKAEKSRSPPLSVKRPSRLSFKEIWRGMIEWLWKRRRNWLGKLTSLLAQGSMARLELPLSQQIKIPVLSSPHPFAERLQSMLQVI
jgi:hypothetical protein